MKGLDPQLTSGDIIIPGGPIRDRIKSAKAEAEKLGASSLIYLKYLGRTEKTKMLTSELDCNYIQELTPIKELKNNEMSRGEIIELIQTITGASLKKSELHWYY